MALRRLTRERYARMRDADEFPDVGVDAVPEPEPAPLIPKRGGKPTKPNWYRIMALVVHPVTARVEADFVAEARTVGEAVAIASRYPFRALVISKSGRKEFNNGKPLELGYV